LNSLFGSRESDEALGARLIRTVWIAAFSLALLGGLFATKVTASMAPAEEAEFDPTTVGAGVMPDTLTKSDRLDVAYLLSSADATPLLPAWPIEVLQTRSRVTASGSSRGLTGLNANRTVVKLPKPRPKIRLSKKNGPAQAAGDLKSCTPPDGLGGLLLSWSGSLRCG
jgi:hypothetical protein